MSAQPTQEPPPDLQAVPGHGGPEMTLIDHLKELRNRVIWCAIALVLGSILCFLFWETILGWLLAPARVDHPEFRVTSFSPTDRIGTIFKIGMYGGIVLASPVWIYHILMFVIPGLTPKERKWILPGILGAIGFLVAGMAFSYYIILPASLGFLLDLGSAQIETKTGIQEYIDFVTRLIFWVGVSFEMPVVLAIVGKLGIIRARKMLGFWRYAILIIVILAAVITPTPDPYNQMLVAAPMFALYFLGVGFAYLLQPRKPRGQPAA